MILIIGCSTTSRHALAIMTTFTAMCMIPFTATWTWKLTQPNDSFCSISCNLNMFGVSPYINYSSACGTGTSPLVVVVSLIMLHAQ